MRHGERVKWREREWMTDRKLKVLTIILGLMKQEGWSLRWDFNEKFLQISLKVISGRRAHSYSSQIGRTRTAGAAAEARLFSFRITRMYHTSHHQSYMRLKAPTIFFFFAKINNKFKRFSFNDPTRTAAVLSWHRLPALSNLWVMTVVLEMHFSRLCRFICIRRNGHFLEKRKICQDETQKY